MNHKEFTKKLMEIIAQEYTTITGRQILAKRASVRLIKSEVGGPRYGERNLLTGEIPIRFKRLQILGVAELLPKLKGFALTYCEPHGNVLLGPNEWAIYINKKFELYHIKNISKKAVEINLEGTLGEMQGVLAQTRVLI